MNQQTADAIRVVAILGTGRATSPPKPFRS